RKKGRPLPASECSLCASGRGIGRKHRPEFLPIPMLPSSGRSVLSGHCRIRRSNRPRRPHSVSQGRRNELPGALEKSLPKTFKGRTGKCDAKYLPPPRREDTHEDAELFAARFSRCRNLPHVIACRVLEGHERADEVIATVGSPLLATRQYSNTK